MTWFPGVAGYELFFNRDERRLRRPATAPRIHEARGVRFVAPIDGDFGGSWLAVSERGLALAIQNGYTDTEDHAREPAAGYTSRGLLPQALIDGDSIEQVQERLAGLDLPRFRSFRLAMLEPGGSGALAEWLHGRLEFCAGIPTAVPVVSSSFEPDHVVASRAAAFAETVPAGSADRRAAHLAYHAGHRPQRGAKSVCMHRPDARTVSFSHVIVDARCIRFRYVSDSPCRGAFVEPDAVLSRSDAASPEPG